MGKVIGRLSRMVAGVMLVTVCMLMVAPALVYAASGPPVEQEAARPEDRREVLPELSAWLAGLAAAGITAVGMARGAKAGGFTILGSIRLPGGRGSFGKGDEERFQQAIKGLDKRDQPDFERLEAEGVISGRPEEEADATAPAATLTKMGVEDLRTQARSLPEGTIKGDISRMTKTELLKQLEPALEKERARNTTQKGANPSEGGPGNEGGDGARTTPGAGTGAGTGADAGVGTGEAGSTGGGAAGGTVATTTTPR